MLASSQADTQFAFCLKWHLLGADERKRLYSTFMSHELNLFLKKKDPQFFAQVVRPFLACKLEKDIVDFYLLDETAAVFEFR